MRENKGSVNEGVLVIIEDYDAEKHRVKVKRLEDNKPLDPNRSLPKSTEQTKLYDFEDKRVLKVNDDPNGPVVEVSGSYSRMSGNSEIGFFSYQDGGNFIKGPLSLVMQPQDIRLAAVTKLNPLIISGFPSTIVTPLPTCIWSIPGTGSVRPIMKSVLMASTLLAATGIA